MNKDKYNSAMDKIKANDQFKGKLSSSLKSSSNLKNKYINKRLISVFATFVIIVSLGVGLLPKLLVENYPQLFEIIGVEREETEDSYISVVYLDGYAYEPMSWLSYSHAGYENRDDLVKGEKLGEVTLDLKGLNYTGRPPDYSSTHDVGTEIYLIEGVKKESAILVKLDKGYEVVFHRYRKAISSIEEPIDLSVNEVFKMMSDSPNVVEVELRSEFDGSWMRTSDNHDLISVINKELADLDIKNFKEIGIDGYASTYRVPINLIFEDGAVLHMQIHPEEKLASIFGGNILISDVLANEFEKLYNLGDKYTRISKLIPNTEDDVNYLFIRDYKAGEEILCEEPKWSWGALYSILNYYQVNKIDMTPGINGEVVFSTEIGSSKDDYMTIEFYETDDEEILLKINDDFYNIVKGGLKYDHLREYILNYTGI